MAEIMKIDPERQAEYDAWVAERPEVIKAMIRTNPATKLYRIKATGQRVKILAYSEDGTVRVNVPADYNLVAFEREVFGVPLSELEECDLPEEGELVGSIIEHLSSMKEMREDEVRASMLTLSDEEAAGLRAEIDKELAHVGPELRAVLEKSAMMSMDLLLYGVQDPMKTKGISTDD